ncbi:MAG: pitrilysin family protein [Tissierellaceae bacterium]
MALKSERIELGNGIYLNLIKTDKFKSNLLSYYFIRPLKRREVTKNALLPLVLKRGTKKYPNNLEIEKKLEEMYGANLSAAVNKRGERQVIRYTMEWASGEYLGEKGADYEVMDILRSIIYDPYLEDGAFDSNYVEQEKENLRKIIEGKINNKRAYAIDRCIEEMCKNERFSIEQLGYVEDLEDIDEANLYSHYRTLLDTSPIEIFYVGYYDEEILRYLKENNIIDREKIVSIPEDTIIASSQTKNMIKEELDISQSKFVIGHRAGIHYKDRLYNALLVANDILGGGPNSKLFKNVREKESLAYYVSSSVYKYKSLLLVDGGIESDKFDKTIDIVRQELEKVKSGDFTDEDIRISIKSLQSSTESIRDSIFLISEFFFSQLISQDFRTLEEILDDLEKVTREEIVEAANKIAIDTIYFMRDKIR